MAWEYRGRRRYYYLKRRAGGKVISEYVGTGLIADMAAQRAAIVKATEGSRRAEWQRVHNEQDAIDKQLDQVSNLVRGYLDALLLTTGHHLHKRQWRKQRGQ